MIATSASSVKGIQVQAFKRQSKLQHPQGRQGLPSQLPGGNLLLLLPPPSAELSGGKEDEKAVSGEKKGLNGVMGERGGGDMDSNSKEELGCRRSPLSSADRKTIEEMGERVCSRSGTHESSF